MLSPLRNRFGIPGVISVIALVFAMLGGAYAATDSGSGKATASAKAKAGPRGPRGKTGPAGPVGPAGPTGPAGAKGDTGAKGDKGDAGSPGAPGKDGTGVTVASFSGSKGTCNEEQGGLEVKSASPAAFVCNGLEGEEGEEGEPGEPGEDGKDGKEGSPWTAGGTLPPGSTETGSWAFNGTEADTAGIRVPISFPILFPFNIQPAHVHFGEAELGGAFVAETGLCPSNSGTTPKAAPGELCIYQNQGEEGLKNATFDGAFKYTTEQEGAARAGALLKFTPTAAVAYGAGSFAVTACTKATEAVPNPPFVCPEGS
jgi:Collagen triple helix repeat (20 copies)